MTGAMLMTDPDGTVLGRMEAYDRAVWQRTGSVVPCGLMYAWDSQTRWSAVSVVGFPDAGLVSAKPWTDVLGGEDHTDVPHDPDHFLWAWDSSDSDFEAFSIESLPATVRALIESDESNVPWEEYVMHGPEYGSDIDYSVAEYTDLW